MNCLMSVICTEKLVVSVLRTIAVSPEFSKTEIQAGETKIGNMIMYIKSHENPTKVTQQTEKKLHNILTQAILPADISKEVLGIEDKGLQLYEQFRHNIFISKSSRLSSTIHRNNLKTFKSSLLRPKTASTTTKDVKKELAEAQKV